MKRPEKYNITTLYLLKHDSPVYFASDIDPLLDLLDDLEALGKPTREDILIAIKNARKNQPGVHVAIHGKTIDALIDELEDEK